MPVIDFKEIPEPHKSTGQQDTFELFCRDFFELLGFNIVSTPNRGADGGADIIIEEIRKGTLGETRFRWLVSCKHKAHSGKSVTPEDESNISDRVQSNSCQGFIGFYSTLPSSGLSRILDGLKNLQSVVYDAQKIEGILLTSSDSLHLANRYFAQSINNWKQENPSAPVLFSDSRGLECMNCGSQLLTKPEQAVVVVWRKLVVSLNRI
jgi:DNA-directed RNA polymerase subunit RPC12/RpoP